LGLFDRLANHVMDQLFYNPVYAVELGVCLADGAEEHDAVVEHATCYINDDPEAQPWLE